MNKKFFEQRGLNLQAVFNLTSLPEDIRQQLLKLGVELNRYNQLILLGHAGRELWKHIGSTMDKADPIDNYVINAIDQYFREFRLVENYQILYPSNKPLGLQRLGSLAGWHFDSPLRVGVNNEWGSWFAYRAVVITDTDFELTEKPDYVSACDQCEDKPCIEVCPVNAISVDNIDLQSCIAFRKPEASPCNYKCLSRLACPVASERRYSDEQIAYHYSVSLKVIRELF